MDQGQETHIRIDTAEIPKVGVLLGVLIGLLTKSDRSTGGDTDVLIDMDWFKEPFSRIRQLPTRAANVVSVLDILMKPARGAGFVVPKWRLSKSNDQQRCYAISLEEGIESGLCVVTSRPAEDQMATTISIGLMEVFSGDQIVGSFRFSLPLLELREKQMPELLLDAEGDGLGIDWCFDLYPLKQLLHQTPNLISLNGTLALNGLQFKNTRIRYVGRLLEKPDGNAFEERELQPDEFVDAINDIVRIATQFFTSPPISGLSFTFGSLFETANIFTKQEAQTDGTDGSIQQYTLTAFGRSLVESMAGGEENQEPPTIASWITSIIEAGSVPFLTKRPNGFGVRATIPSFGVSLGDEDTAINVSAQLGDWLPSGKDKNAWEGRANVEPGLEMVLLQYSERDGLRLSDTPSVRLSAIGFDVEGGKKNPLISGSVFSLDGVRGRFYWDSLTGAFGVGTQLRRIAIPLGGRSTTGEGPAAEILSNTRKAADASSGPIEDNRAEFSIEVIYFWSRSAHSQKNQKNRSIFDITLFDEYGRPTDVIWLPLQKDLGPLTIEKLGVGLKQEKRSWELAILLSGRFSVGSLTLELLDASLRLPLKRPSEMVPALKGMHLSFEQGEISVKGGFLRVSESEYVGELRVELPGCTISVLGIYGQFETSEGGPETSLVIYGSLSLGGGAGLKLGAITITGLALGFGLNRRVDVPDIGGIALFPLVRSVMGDGGQNRRGETDSTPNAIITELSRIMPHASKQVFACLGLRFTIAETIDCFALAVVQFGKSFELSVVGLARFERSVGTTGFCRIELALKLAVKPDDGVFMMQAQLTPRSWVLDERCRLTGGFALCVWFGGPNQGDFILSLGGFHPKLNPPAHYPVVPRVGISWVVSDELFIRGELYFALTPSHLMAGGRLEAVFRSGQITATFVAHVDFLMQWAPLQYELSVGISIRVRAKLLITLDVSVAVALTLRGPPFSGKAAIQISVITFEIEFGNQQRLERIEGWSQFGKLFLDKSSDQWTTRPNPDQAVDGPTLLRTTLARGLLVYPRAKERDENAPWMVRGDEAVFTVGSVIPATELYIADATFAAVRFNPEERHGRHLTIHTPLSPKDQTPLQRTDTTLGIAPLGVSSVTSRLFVMIVRYDPAGRANKIGVDLSSWEVDPDIVRVPGALWDRDRPSNTPAAKMVGPFIGGLARLAPCDGHLHGDPVFVVPSLRASRVKCGERQRLKDPLTFAAARETGAKVDADQQRRRSIIDGLASLGYAVTVTADTGPEATRPFREPPLMVEADTRIAA